MAANEIAERFAAAAWVKFGSNGGEAVNVLTVNEVAYRSRVGFRDTIITSTSVEFTPLFILPLDRTFTRKETSIFANRVCTVGPHDDSRLSYPYFGVPQADAPGLFVQPIMLEWLGADLENPDFMPFGLPPPGGVVPGEGDLDHFDAIAILLSMNEGEALAGDVCLMLYEHPKPDAVDQPVEAALPAINPDPILELAPAAWWRMDDFTLDGGGDVESFNPRSLTGTEGQLVLATPVPPLAPDALFNNELVITAQGNAMTPTGDTLDWDFMGSAGWSAYLVLAPRSTDDSQQNIYISDPAGVDYLCLSDVAGDAVTWAFGVYGIDGGAEYNTAGWAAAEDARQIMRIRVDQAAAQDVTCSSEAASNGGNFLSGPSGTAAKPIFNNLPAGGVLSYAEILMFSRVLSPAEEGVVIAYLATRYP